MTIRGGGVPALVHGSQCRRQDWTRRLELRRRCECAASWFRTHESTAYKVVARWNIRALWRAHLRIVQHTLDEGL